MPPPVQIDHYRILSKLGEGGMGVVYAAEDERLGRRVAIKLLRTNVGDSVSRARLVREARVAAGIADPSICQVYELGEWADQPFVRISPPPRKPSTGPWSSNPIAAPRIAITHSSKSMLAAPTRH